MIYYPVRFSGLERHPYNHAEMLFLRMLLEGIDRALERRWFQIINTGTDTVIKPVRGAEPRDAMTGEKAELAVSHEVLLGVTITGGMYGPDGLCRFAATLVVSDIGYGYGPHSIVLCIGDDPSVTYTYYVSKTRDHDVVYQMNRNPVAKPEATAA